MVSGGGVADADVREDHFDKAVDAEELTVGGAALDHSVGEEEELVGGLQHLLRQDRGMAEDRPPEATRGQVELGQYAGDETLGTELGSAGAVDSHGRAGQVVAGPAPVAAGGHGTPARSPASRPWPMASKIEMGAVSASTE